MASFLITHHHRSSFFLCIMHDAQSKKALRYRSKDIQTTTAVGLAPNLVTNLITTKHKSKYVQKAQILTELSQENCVYDLSFVDSFQEKWSRCC